MVIELQYSSLEWNAHLLAPLTAIHFRFGG